MLFLTLTIALMGSGSETQSAPSTANSSDSIKAVCHVTRFPASCFSIIASLNNNNNNNRFTQNPSDPESIFKLSLQVQVSINELFNLSSLFEAQANSNSNGPALPDCKDQINVALSRINDSVSAMEVGPRDKVLTDAKINDIQTWITAAMTQQETCVDGLEEVQPRVIGELKSKMERCKEYSSSSLAIIANMRTCCNSFTCRCIRIFIFNSV